MLANRQSQMDSRQSGINPDEEEDYYDEDLHVEQHQLTHKLKGPMHRESFLDSDLNKTMSELGGTFRLGNSTFKSSLKPNGGKNMLPNITTRDGNYMTKTRQSSLINKESSKTTLNIMNVTFNSRPGVKQYINSVTRKGPAASQLPMQG